MKGYCGPTSRGPAFALVVILLYSTAEVLADPEAGDMVFFDAGSTLIKARTGPAEECPQFKMHVAPFKLDRTPVSVASFGEYLVGYLPRRHAGIHEKKSQ